MKDFVKTSGFKRDKVVHKSVIGKGEENSHPGSAVSINNTTLADKEITDAQILAEKFDSHNHNQAYDANGAASGVSTALLGGVATEGNTLKKLYDFILSLLPITGSTFSGSIDLSKVDKHYSDYSQTGVLDITIAEGSIIGGSAEVTITANGSVLTVTGATNYGDTTIDYANGKINHFVFFKVTHGIYYLVKQLN